ncbi:MAG TPA: hypothetical protein VKB88_38015 [Bryobacteraceae bacterium]|nr:hypothetical protein [Bryobacteraceae bacterium]
MRFALDYDKFFRQDSVFGGYTPAPKNFDALVIGYDGSKLIFATRTRNGLGVGTMARPLEASCLKSTGSVRR